MKIPLPYGSWPSPFTSDLIIQKIIGLSELRKDGNILYWIEIRPEEQGRYVLMRKLENGTIEEVLPKQYSVRTTVHEYGGGAYIVENDIVYFSNFVDQRLYKCTSGGTPEPLTPEGSCRYADACFDTRLQRIICIREDHTDSNNVKNEIVSVSIDSLNEPVVLVTGNDFYASPRLSPDCLRMAYQSWNLPHMPWDTASVHTAVLDTDGSVMATTAIIELQNVSAGHPLFAPTGELYFVSDDTNFWNIYKAVGNIVMSVHPYSQEFDEPQWNFAHSSFIFKSETEIIAASYYNAHTTLCLIDLEKEEVEFLPTRYTDCSDLRIIENTLYFMGSSHLEFLSIVAHDLSTNEEIVICASSSIEIDEEQISRVEPIEFPTTENRTAHAFYYAPQHKTIEGPRGSKPPLIVMSHGGPTSTASTILSFKVQYWTSRGFAVVDVNYGGSTGYGREYRERLKGNWGKVDIEDCQAAVRYLAMRGDIDEAKVAIRGGSAGGYTTLCALAFTDTFSAGASHFGISDLFALDNETHKFESDYTYGLVGPLPEAEALYRERSPIFHVDKFSSPLILFQGLEDKIVTPNQSEEIYKAVKKKGIPCAYCPYEGEQHGFRKSENIKHALESELYFYGKVFGFTPSDTLPEVDIQNLH